MKKRLISVLLCAGLVASMLAGCGSKEEPAAAEPAETEPAAEDAPQIDDDIDALLDEISFEDLLDDNLSDSEEIPAEDTAIIEEISLDEVEGFDAAAEEKTADAAAADIPEEISFESLEALFKDEK